MRKTRMERMLSLVLAMIITLSMFSAPGLFYAEEGGGTGGSGGGGTQIKNEEPKPTPAPIEPAPTEPKKDLTLIAEVYDYGQDIIAAVIDLGDGNEITTEQLKAGKIKVMAKNTYENLTPFDGERTITGVYANSSPEIVSDDAKPAKGQFIILELKHGFNKDDDSVRNGASTLIYEDRANRQLDLNYTVTLKDVAADVDGTHTRKSDVYKDYVDQLIVDDFIHVTSEDPKKLNYSIYIPDTFASGEKVPVVVWLHGGGEKAYMQGDKEVFIQSPLRANMGGVGWVKAMQDDPKYKAIIVVPQSNYNGGAGWRGGRPDAKERLDDARINEMLVDILSDNTISGNIDPERIYLAGCSNGGAQTLSQLIYSKSNEETVQFAAAMPICPAFSYAQRDKSRKMTDAESVLIKDIPSWFFQAKNDLTVLPEFAQATYDRLTALNGNDIRLTMYPKLEGDLDGEGAHDGHWAWMRALKNQDLEVTYTENKKPFDWLFAQKYSDPKNDLSLIAKVFDYGQDVIAAVIDLGEGKNAPTADLAVDKFNVTAISTLNGEAKFADKRIVTAVYANSKPEVVDGKDKPAEGRYIIIELKHGFKATKTTDAKGKTVFGSDAETNNGASTLFNSKQLDLNYSVTVKGVHADVNGIHAKKSDDYSAYVDQLIVSGFKAKLTKDKLNYYIYTPEEFEGDEKVPVVVWLHGGGEKAYMEGENEMFIGSPIRANKGGVGWVEAMQKETKYKAIIVVPQSNADASWTWNNTDPAKRKDDVRIDNMLKEIMADETIGGRVDNSRIYIAGCSNGGAQTLSSLIYSKSTPGAVQFAAAMPICPSLSTVFRSAERRQMTTAEAKLIKDIPLWFFNAKTDGTVGYQFTEGTYNRLAADDFKGKALRLTLYDKLEGNLDGAGEYNGHWSWTRVLNNQTEGISYKENTKPFDWLFAQKLPANPFNIVVDVFEWGSAVTAVIIDAGTDINASEVTKDKFVVKAVTKSPVDNKEVSNGSRTITNAYVSATNEKGKQVAANGKGRYIVLELKHGYDGKSEAQVDGCAAAVFNLDKFANYWLDMQYKVELKENVTVAGLAKEPIVYHTTVRPVYDDFELVSNPVEAYKNQKYRMYTPANPQNKALPLVLFNHGGGEIYKNAAGGNEGAQLFANMGGIGWVKNAPEACYVLVPQRGYSNYSRAGIIAFIKQLIADKKVDVNRVYVAGPSDGGRETHSFLLENPDVFAAAMPICPHQGEMLTEKDLAKIKHTPIWYVHAKGDKSVDPIASKKPYDALIKMDARDVRWHEFDYVFGNDNAKYPDAHWSWIMVLNNVEVVGGGIPGSTAKIKFMNWLFNQSRKFAVTVSASPKDGGTVTGGGDYTPGASVTVTAAAKSGYTFEGWYAGSKLASKNASYTFKAESALALVAQFKAAKPSGNGGGSGGGVNVSGKQKPTDTKKQEPAAPAKKEPAAPVTKAPGTPAPQQPVQKTFTDASVIPDWASAAVAALVEQNIVSGRKDGSFDPIGNVTRAEFSAMTVKAFKLTLSGAASQFGDVPADAWFKEAVDIVFSNNIARGVGDNAFAPNAQISRQDLCVMLLNALKKSGKELPVADISAAFADDAAIAGYAKEAVYIFRTLGIVNGRGNGAFDPAAKATRAEAAVIFKNVLDYVGK